MIPVKEDRHGIDRRAGERDGKPRIKILRRGGQLKLSAPFQTGSGGTFSHRLEKIRDAAPRWERCTLEKWNRLHGNRDRDTENQIFPNDLSHAQDFV